MPKVDRCAIDGDMVMVVAPSGWHLETLQRASAVIVEALATIGCKFQATQQLHKVRTEAWVRSGGRLKGRAGRRGKWKEGEGQEQGRVPLLSSILRT